MWWGGGEVVNHSSVWASQGLSPAGTGLRQACNRFHKRTAKETAMMNAPMVDISL